MGIPDGKLLYIRVVVHYPIGGFEHFFIVRFIDLREGE
jgi:hypothetical protein